MRRFRSSFATLHFALLALLALLASAGCSSSPLHGVHGSPVIGHLVDSVRVREVAPGQPDADFAFRASPGHVLFVFFGYAHCPDICPTTLSDLRRALKRLGPDSARVEVAFVTVDPGRDSAAILVPFLANFVPGTRALQPRSQPELAAAERAFGATSSVVLRGDGNIEVSHTGSSYVVDPGGRVLVEWAYGIAPADMAADLRTLLRVVPAANAETR